MEFNDVTARLARTLASMNGRFDQEVTKHLKRELIFDQRDRLQADHFFVEQDQADTENKILIILHNLASLKDHLKNFLRANRHDPQLVENEINQSLHLQVLIDLVNQEKHGYPLTRNNRSGKNPVIKNAMKAMSISTGSEPNSVAGISGDFGGAIQVTGNSKITIMAWIHDHSGAMIFTLDDLVNTSFEKLNNLAMRYS